MNLSYELQKLLTRTERSVPVRWMYDQHRGFDRYQADCRASLRRPIPPSEYKELTERGHLSVPLLSSDEANVLRNDLNARGIPIERNSITEPLRIDDPILMCELLERVLTPEIDGQLRAFFQAEYVPYWYIYKRTRPNRQARRAFLWHCDKGPSASAKILLSLTDAAETGGGTDVLDRSATPAFDRAGYTFGAQSDRRDDLSGLARKFDIPFAPRRYALKAGEMLVFLPRHALHSHSLCGTSPATGEPRELSCPLAEDLRAFLDAR